MPEAIMTVLLSLQTDFQGDRTEHAAASKDAVQLVCLQYVPVFNPLLTGAFWQWQAA